jgi:hypothetical protein
MQMQMGLVTITSSSEMEISSTTGSVNFIILTPFFYTGQAAEAARLRMR